MRYNTVLVRGYRVTVLNGDVMVVRGNAPLKEITLAEVDAMLARIEELAKLSPNEAAKLPDIKLPKGECSGEDYHFDGAGEDVMLGCGCMHLTLNEVRRVVARLHEIEKEPEWETPAGLVQMASGYWLRVHEGNIYTSNELGDISGHVMSLEEGKKALEAMEFYKQLKLPVLSRGASIIGTGDTVTLNYACQSVGYNEVKKLLEELSKPVTKTEQPVAQVS